MWSLSPCFPLPLLPEGLPAPLSLIPSRSLLTLSLLSQDRAHPYTNIATLTSV